ncbi:MAG: LptA/OstA family protein [Stenomitos frigidus ULC029]
MTFPRRSPHTPLKLLKLAAVLPAALAATFVLDSVVNLFLDSPSARAQGAQALTLRSDVQEANSRTGVITARGNVQINYPARQIQATSAQALYYSRERRIVLSGNVYVLQQGNSLRGETVTYLIDEGKFLALPDAPKQVESIYLVPNATAAPVPSANPAPFVNQPQFTPAVPALPPTRDLAPPLSSPSSPGSP